MRKLIALTVITIFSSPVLAAVADFEDLTVPPSGYYEGADSAGQFFSGGARFNNGYSFGFWSGFAYSNVNNPTTAGFGNQFAAITGTGHGGSGNYGLAFDAGGFGAATRIDLPFVAPVQGFHVTNTTYAYFAVRDGNDGAGFVRQFGDDPNQIGTGNQGFPDWFKMTIVGDDGQGNLTAPLDFYLADYQASGTANDYVLSDWTWVDLSGLGAVKSLTFTLSSSDVSFGFMNTPAYFAIDNLTYVPEPGILMSLAGLSVIVGLKRRR